ncbi:MAG TPA: hypothetical protein VHV47_14315, partial [Opitutaceae bacterium]|nr:hypothetical protein [Opitutaceae bacterium]
MRRRQLLTLGAALLGALATRLPAQPAAPSAPSGPPAAAPAPARAPGPTVWEADLSNFEPPDYDTAVEDLISRFEKVHGRRLAPGPKKKVGLKVYTDSGPGLETPIPLVKAVIAALERRGFEDRNIFLVGLNALRLRMTGYLPSLVTGQSP